MLDIKGHITYTTNCMKNKTNINTNFVPPYGLVTRLKLVFNMLSTSTYPQITSSVLKKIKFSGSDASLTVSALKFLGLIDQEGKKTELMSSIQLKGEERQKALQGIIKNAYSKLFNASHEANKLNRDELYNNFIMVYGLSGRQASTAVPNFLFLCKEAGLETNEPIEVKSKRTNQGHDKNITKTKINNFAKASSPHSTQISTNDSSTIEFGEFKLTLPNGWDIVKTREAVIKGEFSNVYEQLNKFSEKLKKNQNP